MIRKWHDQKEKPTPKTEVGKTKLTNESGTYTKKTYRKPNERLFSH